MKCAKCGEQLDTGMSLDMPGGEILLCWSCVRRLCEALVKALIQRSATEPDEYHFVN